MRIVVKIGTNVLSNPDGAFDAERIHVLVKGLVNWHRAGWQVVVVSSGAIGAGMEHLGLHERPKSVRDKQAAAAVGQVRLMGIYDKFFSTYDVKVAQVLLTRDDFKDHKRYLNTRNTLMALLRMNIIPIINENDTVSVDEIVLGDNDTLAAIVAMKTGAQKLVMLTDVDGLYADDPRKGGDRECIAVIERITPEIERLCSSSAGSRASTGGMRTKIQAARMAVRAGVEVIIANGRSDATLGDIFTGKPVGTTCVPGKKALGSKKRWIAFGAKVKGDVVIDTGAIDAIRHHGRSLLPAGVTGVKGHFSRGDMISIRDAKHDEIARGISSFSSEEISLIRGKKTSQVKEVLDRAESTEVIHRDNLVIL